MSLPPAGHTPAPAAEPKPTRPRRRRWLRWLAVFTAVCAVLIGLLPTILSMPALRKPLLIVLLAGRGIQLDIGSLSVGWFSPLAATDVRATAGEGEQRVLTVREIRGDASLLALLLGSDLGTFRIVKPEVSVVLDRRINNIASLLSAGVKTPFRRAMRLEVVDAGITIRNPEAPQPWRMEGLQLNLELISAAASPLGVPTLRGRDTTLLNEAVLTPEMCNDLLQFVAPVLAQTTRASGRVSLALDEYMWPLGMPEKAQLKGRLTLHSVEVATGVLMQAVSQLLRMPNAPEIVRLTKDDVVSFQMHDGRVYHENLMFGLADLPDDRMIHMSGSVGLDQTLDLLIDMPVLGASLLPEGQLRDALGQQRVNLHVAGTLNRPIVKLPIPEGQAGPAVKALSELLERRANSREGQPARGLLPNRRREATPPAPADAAPK